MLNSPNNFVMGRNVPRPCPRIEPLEPRTLLAGNVLAAQFGGSVLFARGNAGIDVNRLHAVVNVETEDAQGAIGGRLNIEGLGTFRFNGSATNGLAFFVFTGDNGSGSMALKASTADSSGDLSGSISATINGVTTSGRVRLHSHGGTPSEAAPTSILPAAMTTTPAGVFGGFVRFLGDSDTPPAGGFGTGATTTNRRRDHAVLHLDQDTGPSSTTTTPGLLSGTFRMDHFGRFHVTGAPFFGKTLIVFDGSIGSGALVLSKPDSGTADAFNGLSGKFFATIRATDLHALSRLRATSAPATGTSIGTPIDMDTGTGIDNGFGTTTGTGIGTGIDLSTGTGIGATTGIGTDSGIDTSTGMGLGINDGIGAAAGLPISGIGLGTVGGIATGTSFGTGTGMTTGLGNTLGSGGTTTFG